MISAVGAQFSNVVSGTESACVGHAVKANLCLAAVTLAGTASRALGTTIFFFLIAGFTTSDPVLVFHTAVFADTLFTVLAREELLTVFAKTVLAHFT